MKMASTTEDKCTNYPEFAVICSFIETFGEKFGLTLPNIDELQICLEQREPVHPLLIQTFSILLRKVNKQFKIDRWERALQRFALSKCFKDAWEVEHFGFKDTKLETRLRILKNLVEAQFDSYKSFKDKVNGMPASTLRLQPCGRDKHGVSYWCHLDDCANLRVYSDDQDEETWKLVACSLEELQALIGQLESETPSSVSREMSVEGSDSATPVGLSNAPTPIDSKANTPIASGRNSPIVLDTGQVKIPSNVISEKISKEFNIGSPKMNPYVKMDSDINLESEEVKRKLKELSKENENVEIPSNNSEAADKKGNTNEVEKMDTSKAVPEPTKIKADSEDCSASKTSKDSKPLNTSNDDSHGAEINKSTDSKLPETGTAKVSIPESAMKIDSSKSETVSENKIEPVNNKKETLESQNDDSKSELSQKTNKLEDKLVTVKVEEKSNKNTENKTYPEITKKLPTNSLNTSVKAEDKVSDNKDTSVEVKEKNLDKVAMHKDETSLGTKENSGVLEADELKTNKQPLDKIVSDKISTQIKPKFNENNTTNLGCHSTKLDTNKDTVESKKLTKPLNVNEQSITESSEIKRDVNSDKEKVSNSGGIKRAIDAVENTVPKEISIKSDKDSNKPENIEKNKQNSTTNPIGNKETNKPDTGKVLNPDEKIKPSDKNDKKPNPDANIDLKTSGGLKRTIDSDEGKTANISTKSVPESQPKKFKLIRSPIKKDEKPEDKAQNKLDKPEAAKAPNSSDKPSDVGAAIEEPVMIVKGDGEGAACNSPNPYYDYHEPTQTKWWEDFSSNVNRNSNIEDVIEDEVMYFWGEGNGKDCDAGNSGDESENVVEKDKSTDKRIEDMKSTQNISQASSDKALNLKDKDGDSSKSDIQTDPKNLEEKNNLKNNESINGLSNNSEDTCIVQNIVGAKSEPLNKKEEILKETSNNSTSEKKDVSEKAEGKSNHKNQDESKESNKDTSKAQKEVSNSKEKDFKEENTKSGEKASNTDKDKKSTESLAEGTPINNQDKNKKCDSKDVNDSKVDKQVKDKDIENPEKIIEKSEKEGIKPETESDIPYNEKAKAEKESAKLEKEGAKLEKEGAKLEKEGAKPEKEGAKPEKEGAKPEKEGAKPEKEDTKPEKEGTKPDKEGAKPDKEGAKPDKEGAKPDKEGAKPDKEGAKPDKEGAKPEKEGAKPEKEGAKPEKEDTKPEKEGTKPEKDSMKLKKEIAKSEKGSENKQVVPDSKSTISKTDKKEVSENLEKENETKDCDSSSEKNKIPSSDGKEDSKSKDDSKDEQETKTVGEKAESDSAKSEKKIQDTGEQATAKRKGRPSKATRSRKRTATTKPVSADSKPPKASGDSAETDEGKPKKKRSRTSSTIEAAPSPIPDEPSAPRQRSARIARLREKEEADRRQMEAERLKQLAEENKLKEFKRKAREERRAMRAIKKGSKDKKDKKDKDKKRKKKKKPKKKKPTTSDPWAHSSTSSSSCSEEEEEECPWDPQEDEELVFKSDHEFSPESDIGEQDAQPIKRARTAKKKIVKIKADVEKKEAGDADKKADKDDGDADDEKEEKEEDTEEEEEMEVVDDTKCIKCNHQDHPETILLCDNCDSGAHLSCLRPPLFTVPEGDWLCPPCEHLHLILKLKNLVKDVEAAQKRAQNEELKKQREAFMSVSMSNVICGKTDKEKKKKRSKEEGGVSGDDSESDSSSSDSESESSSSSDGNSSSSSAPLYTLRARVSRTLKEQFEDFDDLIDEAIRDEMEAAAGAGNAGRGKDIENIIEAEQKEIAEKEKETEERKSDEEKMEVDEKPDKKEEIKKETEQTLDNKETDVPEIKTEIKETADEAKKENTEAPPIEVKQEDTRPPIAKTRIKIVRDMKTPSKRIDSESEYEEEDEESEEEIKKVKVKLPPRKRAALQNMAASKKRRRLTDLDCDEYDDDSDEDFKGTSDEEEEFSEPGSESFDSESESDSDSYKGKKKKARSAPVRRSARNRQGSSEESDEEKISKKHKKKKKKYFSSSEADSDDSYGKSRRKKSKQKGGSSKKSRSSHGRSKSTKTKSNKKKPTTGKGRGKITNEQTTTPKNPNITIVHSAENKSAEKPKPKAKIKYSKPAPAVEVEEDPTPTRRVTRGRQINYFNSFLLSEDEEELSDEPIRRGKVMKGERAPSESSDYVDSADERMKRRGVRGGLGRGKVMKDEEEDEKEEQEEEEESQDDEEDDEEDDSDEDDDDDSYEDEDAEAFANLPTKVPLKVANKQFLNKGKPFMNKGKPTTVQGLSKMLSKSPIKQSPNKKPSVILGATKSAVGLSKDAISAHPKGSAGLLSSIVPASRSPALAGIKRDTPLTTSSGQPTPRPQSNVSKLASPKTPSFSSSPRNLTPLATRPAGFRPRGANVAVRSGNPSFTPRGANPRGPSMSFGARSPNTGTSPRGAGINVGPKGPGAVTGPRGSGVPGPRGPIGPRASGITVGPRGSGPRMENLGASGANTSKSVSGPLSPKGSEVGKVSSTIGLPRGPNTTGVIRGPRASGPRGPRPSTMPRGPRPPLIRGADSSIGPRPGLMEKEDIPGMPRLPTITGFVQGPDAPESAKNQQNTLKNVSTMPDGGKLSELKPDTMYGSKLNIVNLESKNRETEEKSSKIVTTSVADTTGDLEKHRSSPFSSKPMGPVTTAADLSSSRGNSPGLPVLNKWPPHLSNIPGTPPRPNLLPGHGVSASPPPYRSSPLPLSHSGPSSPHTTGAPMHQSIPPTSSHPSGYPPYSHPERFPPHPAYGSYSAPGSNSPTTSHNGNSPRHPLRLPHGVPPHAYGFPPNHHGVLRGPHHEMYGNSPQSSGSPNHSPHPHALMKPTNYPPGPGPNPHLKMLGAMPPGNLEPLPYASSPGSVGRHDSPSHHQHMEPKDEKPTGEFSSGLMSYFSSQREDDDE